MALNLAPHLLLSRDVDVRLWSDGMQHRRRCGQDSMSACVLQVEMAPLRSVAVLFILAFITMSAVRASETVEAEVMPLAGGLSGVLTSLPDLWCECL